MKPTTPRILPLIVFFGAIFCFGESYGQGPYDSACYFPKMGTPDELDTIYGGEANQMLGENIGLLPPLNGQKYDRLVMQGLPGNVPFLTAVETGPSFELQKMNFIKKYPFTSLGYNIVPGHFRNSATTDILTYSYGFAYNSDATIYWADEYGEFDTSRYTKLFPFGNVHLPVPYVAKLTSDTVDDIVMSINGLFDHPHQGDTSWIALLRGGQQLFAKGKEASWDDTAFYASNISNSLLRFSHQGDWRGVGREDLLMVDDSGNFYYYKNDPPFNLQRLANAMKYDTLLVAAEWSFYNDYFNGLGNGLAMRAFPKPPGDPSLDLLCPLPASAAGVAKGGICIFKGGPDFGSKRLSYNNPDYLLHSPAYYSGDFANSDWPSIANLGDLTGTGNSVLFTSGSGGIGYSFVALYVLGRALDDKIDCFFSLHYGGGGIDTIRATQKEIPSLIMGAPGFESPEDQARGIFSKGSLRLLHGNERIPVRLNPIFSGVARHNLDESPSHILAYPNPCYGHTVLTFDNCAASKMKIQVVSMSGVEVLQDETPAVDGLQQYAVDLSAVPAGEYIVNLSCPLPGWSSSVKVIKQGAAVKPWTFDLKKMVGR